MRHRTDRQDVPVADMPAADSPPGKPRAARAGTRPETAPPRLTLSDKLTRLKERFRDAEWQRYGLALLTGKFLGVLSVFVVMLIAQGTFLGASANAADPVIRANDIVNPLNTMWVLIAAFLVFGMQIGFTMLEAGFCRTRETVNVLMECLVDTCICGILFWAWGFAFLFGHGNGFIGWGDGGGNNWFFLNNVPRTYESTGVSFLAFWLFQFAFADACSTITSGAMIGRTSFIGDLLYSFGVSGFIYPIIGHWVWGPDGFLYMMGSAGNFLPGLGLNFHDFAGSTVVHTIGGFIALAGAIVLGPRLGRRFARDGGGAMPPNNLVIACTGGFILWFGWYGFNPGSTLSAMDFDGIGRVAVNTTLAACAGALSAMFWAYPQSKKWDLGITVNGFLGGLVAVTCPCYWVNPTGAALIGVVGGIVVVLGLDLLEWLRVDDPIGAVPVHAFCGVWGTLSLGLFACGEFGVSGAFAADNTAPLKGLFYGGGFSLLLAQAIGSVIVTSATFAVSMAMMHAINAAGLLRVSREGELEGLDVHEHGVTAYPELDSPQGRTVVDSEAAHVMFSPGNLEKEPGLRQPVEEALR